MVFSTNERDILVFLLNSAGAAIGDAPNLTASDKRQLQRDFAVAIDHAIGLNDLLTAASLNLKLDEIRQSRAFLAARNLEVVLPGFGGGVVATTSHPIGFEAPERQTIEDVLRFVKLNLEEELQPEEPAITLPSEAVAAPFHYSFSDDRLALAEESAGAPLEGDVKDARQALLDQGERLLETLRTSNSNPHLRSTFEALQKKIVDGSGIVHLGLLNMTCEGAISGAEAEISDVLVQILRAHTTGVRYYLAQFPEWAKFSDNAAELEISRQDVDAVAREISILAGELEKHPFVEADVPRSLTFTADLESTPLSVLRRKGLALVKTLGNLAIVIFKGTAFFGLSLLEETARKTIERLSTALADAVVRTVLELSSSALLQTHAPWLKPAAEAILRYLAKN